MTKNDKQRLLVPKLRFPEYQKSPSWTIKSLGNVCEILNNRRVPITTKDRKPGPYPYYGASGIVDYVDEFIFDERLVLVGEDGAKWEAFDNTAFIAEDEFWVNNHAHVLKPIGVIDTLLVSYLVRSDVGPYVTGAAPPKLTLAKLKRIPIPLPPTEAEQQKIADCLRSLDDLIAAERRNLAALRDHKQGLMQQLFPREGETRPRLRFPEFQGAGDWEVCAVGNIAKIFKGKGVAKADIVAGGLTPCIRYAELYTTYGEVITDIKSYTDVSVSALVLSETEDVIIPASGETKADIATCACVASAGVALGSDLNVLRSKVDGRFLSYYLNGVKRPELAKVAQGDTVAHLYQAQISQLTVAIPTDAKEQRVIADCLSTIDGQISVKVAKLNALRTHKHGLMQQLFPASDSAV
ncbi:restriction endonuclease subunit S [Salinisphaera japonica]|uniref:restriction endonuclease subunit S n=1 Tax=Salinisphaera japonica TaxID=1304270 RepID=UPI000F4B4B56|nr:restriction endonuclease subunit S [Salinisphaera japonica]